VRLDPERTVDGVRLARLRLNKPRRSLGGTFLVPIDRTEYLQRASSLPTGGGGERLRPALDAFRRQSGALCLNSMARSNG